MLLPMPNLRLWRTRTLNRELHILNMNDSTSLPPPPKARHGRRKVEVPGNFESEYGRVVQKEGHCKEPGKWL